MPAEPPVAVGLDVLLDFRRELPTLLAVVEQGESLLHDVARALVIGLPVPPSTEAFVSGPFQRPPGSSRSFYQRLAASSEQPDAGGPVQGVIAIKGMEPLSPGFDAALQNLTKPCYTPHNIAEHFVFEEGKVPACLTLDEAVVEAERAAALQRAHFDAYGQPARVPLPLFVFRHTDDTARRVAGRLRALLSDAATDAVTARTAKGLGVYVYYYPAAPVRVTHVEHLLRGRSFPKRTLALLTMCEPDVTIRGWVTTVARMLYLGYLPGTLASLHTGLCCQPQNACLDGGFVDLDSVTPFSALRDDAAVQAALQLCVEELTRTVSRLLTGGLDDPRSENDRVRVDRHLLSEYVLCLLRQALEAERRPGLELDSRVHDYVEPASSLESLVPRLATYFSTPSRDTTQAWQDFDQSGRAWIDGAHGGHPGYG